MSVIFDVDMFGEKDKEGQIKVLYDTDALKQALSKWVVSTKFNKIRNSSGGYILPLLGKIMNETTADNITKAFQDGLKYDFTPQIEPLTLSVIPNYAKRTWIIRLVGYIPLFKDVIQYEDEFNQL